MARIFLCHASEDKPQVEAVYHRLEQEDGLEPWMDKMDLLPGQNWRQEIPRVLRASEFIIIFLSQNSVRKRGYVQREFKLALDALEEEPEGLIRAIPIRLDTFEVPEEFPEALKNLHWGNLSDERGYTLLLRAIRAGLEQRGQPAPKLATVVVPPQSETLSEWTNSIGMVFVRIPAGSFSMGSPASDDEAFDDERPAHRVEITQPFDLGKYPVTQAQWEAVMGDNPSYFGGNPNRPVEKVSWDDVQRFMAALNERDGGSHYRLPTEAQWEYACRAGTEGSRYHANIEAIAWYTSNSKSQTHAVGEKQPNAWGLYDMLGNVYEWCHDGLRTYTHAAVVDPEGPTSAGANRVYRGGSWDNPAQYPRSARRFGRLPGNRDARLGFRCLSSGREPGSGA